MGGQIYPAAGGAGGLVAKVNTLSQQVTTVNTPPAAVPNNYSDWVEVTAAAVSDVLVVGVAVTSPSPTPYLAYLYVDVGIGGSGAETTLATLPVPAPANSSLGFLGVLAALPVPARISAGTRISVRAKEVNISGGSDTVALYLGLTFVPVSAVTGI